MMNFQHIASRVLNKPLLLEPGYARVFMGGLASPLNISSLVDADGSVISAEQLQADAAGFRRGQERTDAYEVVDGVAVLPISGTLVHKFGYLKTRSGMTGYDGILARAGQAFDDPAVKGVLMDSDTPGGEVAGCFDAAQQLRKMADASGKQLWSLCYDMSCSAGMALASAAHHRLITQTGITGSVGVVMAHASFEKQLKEEGIDITLIHSGARKVEGNPYQKLPAEVLERFEAETNALRLQFSTIVADHIGISVEAVLATEAGTYTGQAAIDVGFADQLVNGTEAIQIFSQHLSSRGRTISLGASMSTKEQPAKAGADNAPAVAETETLGSQAAVETEQVEVVAEEPTPAADAGAAMQQRIAGILQHKAADGRGTLANHLAFNTALSVEDAAAVMAEAAQEESGATASETTLDTVMNSTAQPGVSSASTGGGEQSASDRIVASYNKATGSSK